MNSYLVFPGDGSGHKLLVIPWCVSQGGFRGGLLITCVFTMLSSVGDAADAITVFTEWEKFDDAGLARNTTARTTVFENWVVRMFVKSCEMDEVAATTFMTEVIRHNKLTSCHELHEAANPKIVSRSAWVTNHASGKLDLPDLGTLNVLFTLVKYELSSIAQVSSRVAAGVSEPDALR